MTLQKATTLCAGIIVVGLMGCALLGAWVRAGENLSPKTLADIRGKNPDTYLNNVYSCSDATAGGDVAPYNGCLGVNYVCVFCPDGGSGWTTQTNPSGFRKVPQAPTNCSVSMLYIGVCQYDSDTDSYYCYIDDDFYPTSNCTGQITNYITQSGE